MKFALAQPEDQSTRRNRFGEEQIIGILKEHGEAEPASIRRIDAPPNGVAVSDPCLKHGGGDANSDEWKAEFGGMDVSEARRLRVREDESAELKRMLADARFDKEADERAIR